MYRLDIDMGIEQNGVILIHEFLFIKRKKKRIRGFRSLFLGSTGNNHCNESE